MFRSHDIPKAGSSLVTATALGVRRVRGLSAQRVDLAPLQLLVLPLEQLPDDEGEDRDEGRDGGRAGATGDIAGPVGGGVHVGAVDVGAVADHVGDGDAGAAFDQRPREAVGDPREEDRVGRDGAHRHKEHGEEAGARVERRHDDDVADDRDEHQPYDVQAAVIGSSRCVRDHDRDEERSDPDRRRDE